MKQVGICASNKEQSNWVPVASCTTLISKFASTKNLAKADKLPLSLYQIKGDPSTIVPGNISIYNYVPVLKHRAKSESFR
jgi:hypothetical protein